MLDLDGRAWRHSEAANADADHGLSAADGSEQRLRLATDIGYGGSGCGMAREATTAAAPSAVLALAFFAMAADDIPRSENNMVARADHGIIRPGTRSRRGPQNEPKA